MRASQCNKQTKGATQSQVCSTGGRGAQRGRSAPNTENVVFCRGWTEKLTTTQCQSNPATTQGKAQSYRLPHNDSRGGAVAFGHSVLFSKTSAPQDTIARNQLRGVGNGLSNQQTDQRFVHRRADLNSGYPMLCSITLATTK